MSLPRSELQSLSDRIRELDVPSKLELAAGLLRRGGDKRLVRRLVDDAQLELTAEALQARRAPGGDK